MTETWTTTAATNVWNWLSCRFREAGDFEDAVSRVIQECEASDNDQAGAVASALRERLRIARRGTGRNVHGVA